MIEESLIEQSKKQEEIDQVYNNMMQIQANVVDANIMMLEAGRAAGKTVWFAPRLARVGYSMPGELSLLVHKTYIDLVKNIVPNIRAYFNTPIGSQGRPYLREGIDYVVGEKDLPKHFNKPIFPIENPQHSLVLSNGHNYRLVSSDQPDSIAGANAVHALIEEMKHSDGNKLRSRIFPALRGGSKDARESPYYLGLTGVTDTARVDLGEHDWFNEYEKLVDKDLIKEIVTVFLHINEALFRVEKLKREIADTKDPGKLSQLNAKFDKFDKRISRWTPILSRMRKAATYYIKASTFINKDMLGFQYFKNQRKTMTDVEFLAAIGNIQPRKVTDLFFTGWDNKKHTFGGAGDDSYIYKNIYDLNLKDDFHLTASYLKYFDPDKPLIFGYDPGFFSSVVVGQEEISLRYTTMRIIKEFFCWIPKQQGELAKMIYEFFGPYHRSKRIILYYDRAGNKKKVEQEKITTDARLFAMELRKYGFKVEMKNEYQRTIFYYEHFKLLGMILSESLRAFPRLRVDENECPNLASAINLTPVDRRDGKIVMDKSSEKLPFQLQSALSTQIPSALTYLIYGRYSQLLPGEFKGSMELMPVMVK